MKKEHHAGLIVRSPDSARVEQLIAEYAQRFRQDFFASQPPRDMSQRARLAVVMPLLTARGAS